MPTIQLEIIIHAPQQVVFDLARSIDMHQVSTAHTGEKAIAGRTSGLIELGETVTWQAKHLGITQQLTSKITAMQPYTYFVDEMVSGAFKSIRHEHHFIVIDNFCTRMEDVFNYSSPFGIIGKMADTLFLQNYMFRLLLTRNRVIKKYAEDKMQANNC